MGPLVVLCQFSYLRLKCLNLNTLWGLCMLHLSGINKSKRAECERRCVCHRRFIRSFGFINVGFYVPLFVITMKVKCFVLYYGSFIVNTCHTVTNELITRTLHGGVMIKSTYTMKLCSAINCIIQNI